ncbi:hypothetical protein MMC07_001000 [Pseudocyphellaria aurata]|nr:hypothetical protein [Pseudocyphellaria aurata]
MAEPKVAKVSLSTLRTTFPSHPFFVEKPDPKLVTKLHASALNFLDALRLEGRKRLILGVVHGMQTCEDLARDLEGTQCLRLGDNWTGQDAECGYLIMICKESAKLLPATEENTGKAIEEEPEEYKYVAELNGAYDKLFQTFHFNAEEGWMKVDALEKYKKTD